LDENSIIFVTIARQLRLKKDFQGESEEFRAGFVGIW
jgi:hypothetical protein